MTFRIGRWLVAGAAAFGLAAGLSVSARAETTITLWSHWADHVSKRAFVNEAVKHFEAKHPGVKVKVTWYQKPQLYAALKVALLAGKAPDIFYGEVDQTAYIKNGFLLPLNNLINWKNIEPWARKAWTFNGKTYGFPLEISTIELYYNKALLKKFGFQLPADGQFDEATFTKLVKKSIAEGVTPMGDGVGDRPFPGLYFTYEELLKRLGTKDYGKLLNGELSYKDPRVMAVLTWVKSLVDDGLYPKSFATLKLGESHQYFYSNPGSLMLAMGSWYTTRAFNPPDKGGQPANFPLGIMQFPKPNHAQCPNCKTKATQGSYLINAATKHPKLAADLLNEMATPEMGTVWLTKVLVQGGVKGDSTKITGKYTDYFKELIARNTDVKTFIGLPYQIMHGACHDTLTQVMNVAFPGGLISAKDAAAKMDAACLKK